MLYIDLIFLLNFLIDLLLLMASDHLMGFPFRPQVFPAALLGAVYGSLCALPRFAFLSHPCWYLVFLILLSGAAFGLQASSVRRGGLFLLLSMALGGMAGAIRQAKFLPLVLEALGLWLLTLLCFGNRKIGTQFVPVTVSQGEKTVSFTALRDTGNQLRDPVTGKSVIVVSPRQAQLLTGLTLDQLRHPLKTMEAPPIPGLRLIPYRSVGTCGSMLLGLRFPAVRIGSRKGPALLAFAPEGFDPNHFYEALA